MQASSRFVLVLAAVVFAGLLGFAACVGTVLHYSTNDAREMAERSEVRELHLSSGALVKVGTPFGKISVRTTESGGGSMHAVIRAYGATVEEARERLERARIAVDESSGGVSLALDFKRGETSRLGEQSPSVDFEVLVPAGVKLELASDSGTVTAEGGPFAESHLKSSYGSVRLENVHGDASVDSSSGAVSIAHQSGGRATAKTSYGKVDLSDIDATLLRAETSSGSVTAARIKAPTMELESNYGSIHVDSAAGKLSVRTSSGSVKVSNAEGGVDAKSNYGSVTVDGVLSSVSAHSSSGAVRVLAREGSTIETNWNIGSNYGRVALEAPQGVRFDLDAKTSYGSVDIGYAIELPPGSSTKKGSAIRGKVNGGGPLVTIESSSGSVSVAPIGR